MRELTIVRREGPLGGHYDVRIISNNNVLGEMKADEIKKVFELENSEQAIQAELLNTGKNHFRSNAHFAIYGKKNVELFLTISGTKMILSTK